MVQHTASKPPLCSHAQRRQACIKKAADRDSFARSGKQMLTWAAQSCQETPPLTLSEGQWLTGTRNVSRTSPFQFERSPAPWACLASSHFKVAPLLLDSREGFVMMLLCQHKAWRQLKVTTRLCPKWQKPTNFFFSLTKNKPCMNFTYLPVFPVLFHSHFYKVWRKIATYRLIAKTLWFEAPRVLPKPFSTSKTFRPPEGVRRQLIQRM